MTRMLATTALALTLLTSVTLTAARADEHRGGDAALGALSGAVVFGPVGAVAGAVVGYTAGPSIACGATELCAAERPHDLAYSSVCTGGETGPRTAQ